MRPGSLRRGVSLALAALATFASTAADARSTGFDADDCNGCHSGGREPTVRLTAVPTDPAPGAEVTLRVAFDALNGPAGGFYLRSSGAGAFSLVSGQGTRLLGADAVTHSAPRAAAGGQVAFEVRWRAPATPGGVDFFAAGLSANRDGTNRGDAAGTARLSLVYGCAGGTYYRDLDGDGHGSSASGTTRACAPPAGYVERDGDCNDSDERVHPGAVERCNRLDDDCDGQADEGLAEMAFYPDADGDGYGGRGGTPVTGCGMSGYGVGDRDCDDRDPAVNPGATEVCDGRDNDCDGRTDERVRPTCGVGLCARAAFSCDPRNCEPGEPTREACNGLDDDCNGVVDDGPGLCPTGQTCAAGACVPAGSAPDGGATGGDGGAPGGRGDGGDDADAGSGVATSGGCTSAPANAARGGGGAACGAALLVALLACGARRRRSRRALARPLPRVT